MAGTAGEEHGLAVRLAEVRERIAAAAKRSGRRPEQVLLVAVSKTVPAAVVAAAAAAGQRVFGENRVQEALAKSAGAPGLAWHLIGHLQSNKAKLAAGLFDVVETLDSVALAAELDRRAQEAGRRPRVLVQIKIGEEATKSGVSPEQAPALLDAVWRLPHLELAGLMAIPPPPRRPGDSRRWFARLRELRERWDGSCCPRGTLRELSMGMSADFEEAIEEGATIVRVGTQIFGARGAGAEEPLPNDRAD